LIEALNLEIISLQQVQGKRSHKDGGLGVARDYWPHWFMKFFIFTKSDIYRGICRPAAGEPACPAYYSGQCCGLCQQRWDRAG
jgi:hypothetical protein